jgi:fatty acid desaturase
LAVPAAEAEPAVRVRRIVRFPGVDSAFGGGWSQQRASVLTPPQALVFLVVHQCVFGLYMGCTFAPNHKGMPILCDDDKLDYLRRQVLTSRNVRGGRFTDFVLGGLNYQIEHHLFPSMPRPSLRRAQAIVRAHCGQHGLAYHESSVLGSYAQVLRHLHAVGAPLRPAVDAG